MGIGQVITMPLFFASNAIYPMELMPSWLRNIASFNPLTYLVDALRGQMVIGGTSHFPLSLSFGIMIIVFSILTISTAKIYPSLAH
jgi:ABC-2 type transport system permease protein